MAKARERADRPILYRPAVQAAGLAATLGALWLLLSGQIEPWFLVLGVLSVALAVLIAIRMDLIDHEGAPVHIYGNTARYWVWLAWEIAKADWQVSKLVFSPLSRLSPRMVRAPASQRSAVGQATYANSITLTPGTVTVDVETGAVLVHALTREAAAGVEEGEMDRRAQAME